MPVCGQKKADKWHWGSGLALEALCSEVRSLFTFLLVGVTSHAKPSLQEVWESAALDYPDCHSRHVLIRFKEIEKKELGELTTVASFVFKWS